jgi:orotate phosphoribosyltransferase
MNQRQREIEDEITPLLPACRGHFLLESGHHGDLWLDLELLCLRPERIRPQAAQIAARLAGHNVEVVCGPLVEGAFVALMVAEKLGLPFTYAERFADASRDALYPVQYRLPRALRDVVRGKRVAIVNDVINAGSAIRGTFAELQACGAVPVVIATLAVLGKSAARFAADHKLALITITSIPNEIWIPAECPLCARGIPLDDFLNTKAGVA